MFKSSLALILLVISAAVVPVALAQQPPAELSDEKMLGLMRTVNTAQMGWFSKHQTFASLQDVEQDKFFSDRKEGLNRTGPDSATVEGYELKVVLSSDGKHYSTSLIPIDGCGVAVFSDEQGVIYRAKALGCE